MSLAAGVRLGPYEIQSAIGAGGMGEVWRARDTVLGRDVALKILPDHLALDPDRLARFRREAQILASLNHPNIAAIHGFQESDGVQALVLELVEGPTLADRIAQGPIPIEEALPIARQIAEALESAHEKGIVHRDLKPANVKVTPDQKVKVLDFGLAKAMEPAGVAPGDASHSPTLSMMATQAGVILGTAAYMSPEQAKGFPADQRSDVFSFGSVLYEMITGRQPFQGDTAPDILASVLVREPDLTALPPNLNPRTSELLRRCFEKKPKRRWQAVGDLRAEIEAIATAPRVGAAGQEVAIRLSLWKWAIPVTVSAVVSGAFAAAAAWNLHPLPSANIIRFALALPEGQNFTNPGRQLVAISPDGRRIVYVANLRLYSRSMSDLEARPILGSDAVGVLNPVFSPDGESLVFYSAGDDTLKKIRSTGGAALTIGRVGPVFGMSWGAEGILVGQGGGGIVRLSPDGGTPEQLVTVKTGELAHGPQMLPGGQHILFTLATNNFADRWETAQIVVQSLKSGDRKILIEGGNDARYLPTGHLVYAVGGTILAVPFDLERLEIKGGAVPMVEGVRRVGGTTGSAQFAISEDGSLIYVPGPASIAPSSELDIAFMDRKGSIEPLKLPPGPYQYPRVSRDGRRIAFGTDDGKEAIIWVRDLSSPSPMRRLTFGGKNRLPVWSSDGQRVAFQSDRDGDPAIFWQLADGSDTAERLTKPEEGVSHVPESWSPTGEFLLFSASKGSTVTLWTLSIKDKRATPFGGVQSTVPTNAVFSPDGRWVAYGSNDQWSGPGVTKLYIQPFPATGAIYQLFSDGKNSTNSPVWSSDGKELFYIPRNGGFAAISVVTQPTFTLGNAVEIPRRFPAAGPGAPRTFDIAPDGRAVGVIAAGRINSETATAAQITVVLNWFEELKQRVPNK